MGVGDLEDDTGIGRMGSLQNDKTGMPVVADIPVVLPFSVEFALRLCGPILQAHLHGHADTVGQNESVEDGQNGDGHTRTDRPPKSSRFLSMMTQPIMVPMTPEALA